MKPPREKSDKPRKVTNEQRPTLQRQEAFRKAVVDVRPEPNPDLFGCPGCMKKMRGTWRYCDRCESKRNTQGVATPDGFIQLPLFVQEEA